jgi:hypothetical protein
MEAEGKAGIFTQKKIPLSFLLSLRIGSMTRQTIRMNNMRMLRRMRFNR